MRFRFGDASRIAKTLQSSLRCWEWTTFVDPPAGSLLCVKCLLSISLPNVAACNRHVSVKISGSRVAAASGEKRSLPLPPSIVP